jgi:hypothetical protein
LCVGGLLRLFKLLKMLSVRCLDGCWRHA